MRHSDFLKPHHVLLSLWALVALMSMPAPSACAAPAALAPDSSSSLILSAPDNNRAPAATDAADSMQSEDPNAAPDEIEGYSDSMIRPSRPQGMKIYPPSQESNANDTLTSSNSGSSLVDVANNAEPNPYATVVIYFSAPESTSSDDVDSLTGASVVAVEDQRVGLTGALANYIGHKIDAPVLSISVDPAYPQNHEELIVRSLTDSQAIAAQNYALKIALEPQVDLTKTERIFIGFPLWWNDLPLPVYAFFDSYDLSGKTIIPFCTYGNTAPYQLFNIVKSLEPNAKVQRGLPLDKHRLLHSRQHKKLDRWLEDFKAPTTAK